jgi:hypothetical protein
MHPRDHRFERGRGRFGNTPLEMRQERLLQHASRSEFARSCTSEFARSCTSVSQPARSSRTQHCCKGGRSAADRLFDVGRTTRGLPGSPGIGGHASRTGVEVSAHRDHSALLPRQHSRCAGVRGAERTSKEHRSDKVGANQETSTEEPAASLRNVPTRAISATAAGEVTAEPDLRVAHRQHPRVRLQLGSDEP